MIWKSISSLTVDKAAIFLTYHAHWRKAMLTGSRVFLISTSTFEIKKTHTHYNRNKNGAVWQGIIVPFVGQIWFLL